MNNNPFTLAFGKKPLQYVSRIVQTDQIVEDYVADPVTNQIYMVTGVRGSGKTVMMTNIAGILSERNDWMCEDHHYDLYLAQADGGSRAELRLTTGDAQCVKASVPLEQGQQEVKLHVESDEEIYTFFAEIAGEKKELGKARTKYLSSEVAGGFTGTVMAMYAVNPEEKEDAWGEFTGLNWTMKKWVDNA